MTQLSDQELEDQLIRVLIFKTNSKKYCVIIVASLKTIFNLRVKFSADMDIECLLMARLCLTIHSMVMVVVYRTDWMTNTSYETFSFRIEPSIFQEKKDYCTACNVMKLSLRSIFMVSLKQ